MASQAMNPELWSRLPLELLHRVMQYASRNTGNRTDRDALCDKWKQVAFGNHFLYDALLSQHWEEVNLTWIELLRVQTEQAVSKVDGCTTPTDAYLPAVSGNGLEPTGLIRKMLSRQRNICPGQHVRRLNLLFYQDDSVRSTELGTSHQSIQRSLNIILPVMRKLRHVAISGPPSNTVLAALTQLTATQLQKLETGGAWYDYQHRNFTGEKVLDIYDWKQLANFRGLTELKISHLDRAEIPSLAQTIPQLQALRSLVLITRYNPIDLEVSVTPLQALFRNLGRMNHGNTVCAESPDLLCLLPSNLERLDIQDHYFLGENALEIVPSDESINHEGPQCCLKSLLTELDDLQATRNLLTWLSDARLERISFSPVLRTEDESIDSLTEPLRIANEIISRHQSTLREIVFSNIWKAHESFANDFTKAWRSHFRLTDLILGSDCIKSRWCTEPHLELNKQSLKHVLFGCSENASRWGSDIQRLRLEMPWSTHDIDFAAPDLWLWSSMRNLRVLIISPHTRCGEAKYESDEADVKYMDHEHVDIMRGLLYYAPKSLRYIQLCQQAWWLDPQDDGSQDVVTWYNAYTGTGVKHRIQTEVMAWLTPEDEEFILPDSPLNTRREGGFRRRIMTGSPEEQFLLQATNLLIARRYNEAKN